MRSGFAGVECRGPVEVEIGLAVKGNVVLRRATGRDGGVFRFGTAEGGQDFER